MSGPILVGYDPRTRDGGPVRFGAAAARFLGAPLLIACADPDDEDCPDVEATLAEVRGELAATRIPVEAQTLRGGSAARVLHEAAEREDATLLVVGSRRDGPLDRLLPGSTALRLLHGATCPVAVVPWAWETRGGLRTVGVGFVDTPEGREALRAAYALARAAGASLRVITVHRPHIGMYLETEPHVGVRPSKSADMVEGEHRVRAEKALRAVVADLGADVPVETDAFAEDDAAGVLIRVSAQLDLLVCGSRGYGPLRAVALGGVTRRVVTEAACPVTVLPRGVRAPFEALPEAAAGAAP